MEFADLHIHALCGVDDGAPDTQTMYAMLDAAWQDGTRILCFTPHAFPAMFGRNQEKIASAFSLAQDYVAARGYAMSLFLGSEIHGSAHYPDWADRQSAPSLHNTRYVLVDFDEGEQLSVLRNSLLRALNAGRRPILAHAERYHCFKRSSLCATLRALREDGVLIQVDAGSLLNEFSLSCAAKSRAILSEGLCDLIASDAHGVLRRPPRLSEAYRHVSRRYGTNYATSLFWKTPCHLLGLDRKENSPDGRK